MLNHAIRARCHCYVRRISCHSGVHAIIQGRAGKITKMHFCLCHRSHSNSVFFLSQVCVMFTRVIWTKIDLSDREKWWRWPIRNFFMVIWCKEAHVVPNLWEFFSPKRCLSTDTLKFRKLHWWQVLHGTPPNPGEWKFSLNRVRAILWTELYMLSSLTSHTRQYCIHVV